MWTGLQTRPVPANGRDLLATSAECVLKRGPGFARTGRLWRAVHTKTRPWANVLQAVIYSTTLRQIGKVIIDEHKSYAVRCPHPVNQVAFVEC